MSRSIGFIGLGVMGAPMAAHVAAKFGPITVYDIDAAKTQRLVDQGQRAVAHIAEIGHVAEVVILSLPNSQIVEEVVLGSGNLVDTMRPGGTIIDTSTTDPTVSKKLAAALQARGLHFLDAPMSGGEKAAIDGTLSFMVGGDESVFQACFDIFESMGTTIVHMGEVGAGEIAKMVNQMIVGATFAIVAESFALGVKAGLDPSLLYEAIRNGWAGSKVLDVAAPAMLARNFRPGGTVNILCKDLQYALSLANSTDVPTPVTSITYEISKAARASGSGGQAQPVLVTLWEKLLGVEVTKRE